MLTDYAPLELINLPTKHDLYIGHYRDQKVFIKKYLIRHDTEIADREKMTTEMACYEKLPQLDLPKPIETNLDEQFIVLPFIDYQKVLINEQTIDQVLTLHKNLESLDGSFLQATGWEYYQGQLFKTLDLLQETMSVELDTSLIRTTFLNNRSLLEKQTYTFSHGDFHFDNVRWHDGIMVLIDWENAHRDNRYYDLASMYQSFFHTENGLNFIGYFYERINRDSQFDESLFRLMVLRRCINVLYYFRNRPKEDLPRKQTFMALTKTLSGDSLADW